MAAAKITERSSLNFSKIRTVFGNGLPTNRLAWASLLVVARGAFLAALTVFFGLLLFSYLLFGMLFFVVLEDVPDAGLTVAVIATLFTQAAFGATMALSRVDVLLGIEIQSSIVVLAVPTLLTILVATIFVLFSKRMALSVANHRGFAVVLSSLILGLTLLFLNYLLSFATNRYARFPVDSDFSGFFVDLLLPGNAFVIFGVAFIPAFLGGIFVTYSKSTIVRGLSWYLTTLRGFFVSFLLAGLVVLVTLVFYRVLSVDFVTVRPVGFETETDGGIVATVLVLLLLYLPTLLANILWLSSGSVLEVELDSVNNLGLLDDLISVDLGLGWGVLFEPFSLWQHNRMVAVAAIIVLLGVALFAGSVSSHIRQFRLKSFWPLPLFLILGVLVALLVRRLSSTSVIAEVKTVAPPDASEDVSSLISNLGLGSVSVSFGVSEFSAIVFSSAVLLVAFVGALYLREWLPNVFPRFAHVISMNRHTLEPEVGASITQKWSGRIVLIGLLGVALLFLALATAERIYAQIDSPNRHTQDVVAKLVEGSLGDVKSVFAEDSSIEWLPDEVLTVARIQPSGDAGWEITNLQGANWQVGELVAESTVTVPGEGGLIVTLPMVGEVRDYPLGFSRASYTGAITPPIIDVEIPEILKDSGVTEVTLNGVSIPPGRYLAIPGLYEIGTEKKGIVSATRSLEKVVKGEISLRFEPRAELPSATNLELNERLVAGLDFCSEIDSDGKSDCFSIEEGNKDAESLEGPPPVDFFDFVTANDYAISLDGCEDSEDTLVSAFTLVRSQTCEWQIDATRTYYDTRMLSTPVYSTGTRSYWEPRCNWVSDGYYSDGWWDWNGSDWIWNDYVWNDTSYWSGCYQQENYEYQSGTRTSEVRGNEIFSSIFRIKALATVEVTAQLKEGVLEVSAPVINPG